MGLFDEMNISEKEATMTEINELNKKIKSSNLRPRKKMLIGGKYDYLDMKPAQTLQSNNIPEFYLKKETDMMYKFIVEE